MLFTFLLTSWKKADTKKTAMAALIFEMPLLSMGLYKCLKQIQIFTLMFWYNYILGNQSWVRLDSYIIICIIIITIMSCHERNGWPRSELVPTTNVHYNSLLWMYKLNPISFVSWLDRDLRENTWVAHAAIPSKHLSSKQQRSCKMLTTIRWFCFIHQEMPMIL